MELALLNCDDDARPIADIVKNRWFVEDWTIKRFAVWSVMPESVSVVVPTLVVCTKSFEDDAVEVGADPMFTWLVFVMR